jgi:hypothetical protein
MRFTKTAAPLAKLTKAAEILLTEGPTPLFFRIRQSINAWILNQRQQAAYLEIDRLAASNISISEKFSTIYQKRLWLRAMPHLNPEKTLSGHGSTQLSTKVFRSQLETFLHETRTHVFLDAPCGDFNWMKNVKLPDYCAYIGGDIVADLIADLQQNYSASARVPNEDNPSYSLRQFIRFDLTKDSFPLADVWLCKDCLQHLSNGHIILVLNNFRRSRVKFALLSNHIGVKSNVDIETGSFRHVDLTLPPFNLPPPLQRLRDSPNYGEPRYVGVWRREDLN